MTSAAFLGALPSGPVSLRRALSLTRRTWRAEHRDFISCSVETARYPRTTVSTLSIATLLTACPRCPCRTGKRCTQSHRRWWSLAATVRLDIDALFLAYLRMAQSTGLAPAHAGPPAGCPQCYRSIKGGILWTPGQQRCNALSDITLDHVPSKVASLSSHYPLIVFVQTSHLFDHTLLHYLTTCTLAKCTSSTTPTFAHRYHQTNPPCLATTVDLILRFPVN